MEISDFFDSFFEEAEELLADMERLLLGLDPEQPEPEQLHAIFRAAHSIKGGAGAFGFKVLQDTTHVLENLLDLARHGKLSLTTAIIDILLESKDVLQEQLECYRRQEEPDAAAYATLHARLGAMAEGEPAAAGAPETSEIELEDDADPLTRIARVLQRLAREAAGEPELAAVEAAAPAVAASAEPAAAGEQTRRLAVTLKGVNEKDRQLLLEELGLLGQVLESGAAGDDFEVVLATGVDADAIEAVMCFVIEPHQVAIHEAEDVAPVDAVNRAPAPAADQAPTPAAPAGQVPPTKPEAKRAPQAGAPQSRPAGESASIRVPVDKVDQIINLVGELIITQSMLDQCAGLLDEGARRALEGGLLQLQRNARDLQESVMSIRMLPMDYVFSRFPRQVRDLAAKLGKEVELVLEGKSTELDKGLIERITDPLTHLVRNSLDHGIESPAERAAAGKPPVGRLLLSARHQGGNIVILVSDDGKGLDRGKLLAKARSKGLDVHDGMSDDEVWQLIFAPGFSTAEEVSDVSGRGVGMDVVKRNIQSMGGHVELMSSPGQGTTVRVVLPLTLAILDGMLVRVGGETFVLPLAVVSELVQPTTDDFFTMAGDDLLLRVRKDYLPVVVLRDVMGVPGEAVPPEQCIAVIVEGEEGAYALMVDEPVGQQQVVVKNLESNYRKVPGVSAATILGDGRVALILDAAGLYRCDHRRKKFQSSRSRQPQHFWEVEPS